jgi:hypothetical protein
MEEWQPIYTEVGGVLAGMPSWTWVTPAQLNYTNFSGWQTHRGDFPKTFILAADPLAEKKYL